MNKPYSIHHPEAMGTVSATSGAAGELSGVLGAAVTAIHSAQSSLCHSGAVVDALAAVQVGAIAPAADTVMSKVNTATGSTSEALGHYLTGDQVMASNVCAIPSNPDMPGVN